MWMSRSTALAVGLAMLAGCVQHTGYTPNGAPNAPPQAKCDGCTPVDASGVPRVKAGYWDEATTGSGGAPTSGKYCTRGYALGPRALLQGCTSTAVQRTSAGAYWYDVICVGDGSTAETQTTYSGDLTSSFTIDDTATNTMSGRDPQVTKRHTEAHYLGDCPAGVQPTD